MQGSDDGMLLGGEADDRSEAGSDMSRSQPYDEYDADEVRIEVLDGEEAAEAAREVAAEREKPETPSDTESDGVGRRCRKRKFAEDSDDEDSVDRLVPFMVHGFCQGCKCKQNVYVLGPVKERRRLEADRILFAMQERYKVPLVRGERRTVDKPSSPFDSSRVSTDTKGIGVSITGRSR